MAKQRILITGASGFIGAAMSRSLAQEYELWTISGREAGVEKGQTHNIQVDISQDEAVQVLRSALPSAPFHAVLHFAACTPRSGENRLAAFMAANAVGAERLLSGLPVLPHSFAYFSTVDVYGRPGIDTILTEGSPVAPETYYALSKYAGERVVRQWCGEHGLPHAIFRLGQVYGPDDPTGKVISAFCTDAAAGRRPTIYGAGNDMRQPIHVWDVVAAIAGWLQRPPPQVLEPFLLAGGERASIGELARLVARLACTGLEPRIVPQERSQRIDYLFNTELTQKRLQWSPTVTLREGIAELLEHLGRSEGKA